MDAGQLTVPLWGAIAIGGTIISSLIGLVVWAFSYFASKSDHENLDERVTILEGRWAEVNGHLQYIRGRLEPKP